jgi:hypothetical protein
MRPQTKPVKISDELAAKCDGPNQFKSFDALVGNVLAVPHTEIVSRERQYKKQVARNPNKRGPKPKNGASRDLRA